MSNTVKKTSKFFFFIKRSFDIFASFIAITLLSPLLILLYIVNLFFTKCHPVFCDKRIGKKGKQISVIKFRTMYYDAETNINKYLTKEQFEKWSQERKIEDDPRITKFGNILRRTSLDELPQLFNILFGSMSFVGYRPMTKDELEQHFTAEERKLLYTIRPGLTGNWQVNGRNNVTFDSGKRQRLELDYFDKMSAGYDLKILFKTVTVVFKEEGAK